MLLQALHRQHTTCMSGTYKTKMFIPLVYKKPVTSQGHIMLVVEVYRWPDALLQQVVHVYEATT